MPRLPEDEFERFFRTEHGRVLGLAIALIGDRNAAGDVVQEAFARAYRHWDRVVAMDAPAAWVKRVTANLAIDRHRRLVSERNALARQHALISTVVLDDPGADEWWAAVRALPERQRAAVALHYLEDRSIDEIARILDIATGTVKSSLAAARATLARTLTEGDLR